tara:strand:+ start:184 stop:1164 length:981 start_codon:yes stop_codon:yes gene_type:complete
MVKVIGGSGFVGSFLIKELIKTHDIQNFDKNASPFFGNITKIGNILNKNELIFKKSIKTIILLAAEHRDDVFPTSLYYDVNVKGIKNVLDAMDKANIKNIIFTSSVAIYGLNKPNPNEKFLPNPFNHYGKSKWKAELVLREWFQKDSKNKSVTIIRPTVIFGERNRGNVYNLFNQVYNGKFIMIGRGDNKKSMAYVGNVVAFIINRLNSNDLGFHVFNYSDKPDYSMTQLVNVIQRKMNIKLPKIYMPYWLGICGGYFFDFIAYFLKKKLFISSIRVKKFCATTQFNSAKAHDIFKAPYTLEEGVNKTLDHEFINPKQDDILFFSE